MTTRKLSALKAAFGSLLVAVLTLGMAVVPQGASAATVVDSNTVRVERGDTLTGIARQFLGDASRFDEIAELNDLEDPNLIITGQTLDLPSRISTGSGTSGGTSGGTTTDDDDGLNIDSDLIDLVILEELFRGDDQGEGERDLFDLIILDEVVGDNGGGLLDDNGDNDLIDLFILDELFNRNNNDTNTNM